MAKLKFAFAFALLAGSLFAGGDVTGKWAGSVTAKTPDGNTEEQSAWMSLTQTGTAVTGLAGESAERAAPIKEGKADGDLVEFKVTVGENEAKVRLRLEGDHLKGVATVDTPDGPVTANLDLKRVI
jgi:hypothetical protein